MNVLIASWLRALTLVCPRRLLRHIAASVRLAFDALRDSYVLVQLLLTIQVLLMLLAGRDIVGFITAHSGGLSQPHQILAAIHFAVDLSGLGAMACLVIFMLPAYRNLGFLRYVGHMFGRYAIYNLAHASLLIAFFIIAGACGVQHVPTVIWPLLGFYAIFKSIGLLFWFEGPLSIRAFFQSLERAINFILYQLPFLLLLAVMLVGSYGLLAFLCAKGSLTTAEKIIFSLIEGDFWAIFSKGLLPYSGLWAVLVRLSKFVIDAFFLAFFMTWFLRYRGHVYTKPVL